MDGSKVGHMTAMARHLICFAEASMMFAVCKKWGICFSDDKGLARHVLPYLRQESRWHIRKIMMLHMVPKIENPWVHPAVIGDGTLLFEI